MVMAPPSAVIPGRPHDEPGIHRAAQCEAQRIPGLHTAHASRNDGARAARDARAGSRV